MPRWLRITLKITGAFIGLLLLLWAGLAWYITSHKKALLQNITAQLNKNIQGTLAIADMHPSFLFSLPYFSVSLDRVSLRDSLYKVHHHDLLNAERIYVQINPLTLLSGKPRLHQITVQNGSMYLYTDSSGYTNAYLLHRRDTTEIKHKRQAVFQKLELQNVQFTFENKVKNKLFKLSIADLTGKMKYSSDGWNLLLKLKTRINEFNFNTEKGSFLKGKNLETSLNVSYIYATKLLTIPAQPLYIDDHPINISGTFSFAAAVPAFSLKFDTKDIKFKEARSLVSPNIARHFDSFDFSKPVDVQASVQGYMKFRDTPTVRVNWQVTKNTFFTPVGELDNCSMTGWFDNEVIKGYGHTDPNSEIMLSHLKATWGGMPFSADTVHIANLKKPVLFCHIKANFPVQGLNAITGTETFRFDTGKTTADIVYRGSVNADDTVQPYINGFLKLENAGITYMPRDLSLNRCNALLHFTGNDLFIQNVEVHSKESILYMNGHISNFLSLYFNSPQKMVLDWNVNSPIVNMNEFKSFLGQRKRTNNNVFRKYQRIHIANKLDDILDECNVNMQLNVNKLVYRKFVASGINANVLLTPNGISIKNVSLNHAGGSLSAEGNVVGLANGRRSFDLHAKVNHVKIDQLFYAFDNFGQDAIDKDNIKGDLTADIRMAGQMNSDASIVRNSLQGTIDFNLQNGALVHFEPFEKISKFAFKKRNLSDVTFGDVKTRFDVQHNKIIINPMLITSSAINFHIQGVYAPPHNTNISLEVPLRNPKEVATDSLGNWNKGLVLYLSAQDGDDGKIKIGWDRTKGIIKKGKRKFTELLAR